MSKSIIISIDVDGNIGMEVKGASGPECLAMTADLEEAFGVVTDRTSTSEMFATKVATTQKVGLG